MVNYGDPWTLVCMAGSAQGQENKLIDKRDVLDDGGGGGDMVGAAGLGIMANRYVLSMMCARTWSILSVAFGCESR